MRATRTIAVTAATVALLTPVLSAPSWAGPKPSDRYVVVREYVAPHSVRTNHWDDGVKSLPERPPLVFQPRAHDRWLRVDLHDDVGEDLYIELYQPGRTRDLDTDHCGDDGVFRLVSSEPVEVRVYSGLCRNHLFGIATKGRIVATFSPYGWGKTVTTHSHHH